MIEVENFHHVSLSIDNLEAAKHFYGTILGFSEIDRPDFDFPGAWYQVGNQQLHLIVHSRSETLRFNNEIETKDSHFAIRVKDYEKTLHYLKRSGIKIVEKPKSKSGFSQIFCTDPSGNIIEFNVDQTSLKT